MTNLPEPFAWVNQHEAEDYIDGVNNHFTALRRGVPGDDFPIYSAAQVRACIEANTEELWADVAFRDSVIATHAADTREYQKRISRAEALAERLTEALQLAEEHINALTPEWYSAGQRVLAAIRNAIHPTAAQESKP